MILRKIFSFLLKKANFLRLEFYGCNLWKGVFDMDRTTGSRSTESKIYSRREIGETSHAKAKNLVQDLTSFPESKGETIKWYQLRERFRHWHDPSYREKKYKQEVKNWLRNNLVIEDKAVKERIVQRINQNVDDLIELPEELRENTLIQLIERTYNDVYNDLETRHQVGDKLGKKLDEGDHGKFHLSDIVDAFNFKYRDSSKVEVDAVEAIKNDLSESLKSLLKSDLTYADLSDEDKESFKNLLTLLVYQKVGLRASPTEYRDMERKINERLDGVFGELNKNIPAEAIVPEQLSEKELKWEGFEKRTEQARENIARRKAEEQYRGALAEATEIKQREANAIAEAKLDELVKQHYPNNPDWKEFIKTEEYSRQKKEFLKIQMLGGEIATNAFNNLFKKPFDIFKSNQEAFKHLKETDERIANKKQHVSLDEAAIKRQATEIERKSAEVGGALLQTLGSDYDKLKNEYNKVRGLYDGLNILYAKHDKSHPDDIISPRGLDFFGGNFNLWVNKLLTNEGKSLDSVSKKQLEKIIKDELSSYTKQIDNEKKKYKLAKKKH